MLEFEKLPILFDAFPEYLRLDDLARTEIEQGYGSYKRIFDESIQVIQDKLIIRERSLFDLMKNQSEQYLDNSTQNRVALAFPTIRRVKGKGREQRNLFYPAFVLDVSPIFKGNFRSSGWDLKQFDVHPIAPNLIEFFGLEEPEIDTLLVNQGIHRFLQDVFKQPFPTLQAFLQQVDLPAGCQASRTAYLVRLSLKSVNTLLRADFFTLQQQLAGHSGEASWSTPDHPLMQFLFGVPAPPRRDAFFWAIAPGTVPDAFQADALKHSQDNNLVAVLGSPGSGKTELGLYWCAQQVWKRAHAKIYRSIDLNNLCLYTATNSGAIAKFKDRLTTRIPSPLLYLPGGKRKTIEDETLPKIRSAVDWLQLNSHDEELHQEARRSVIDIEAQLVAAVNSDFDLQDQKQHDRQLLEQQESEIEALKQTILELETSQAEYSCVEDFSEFPQVAYKNIQKDLDQAWQELSRQDDPLLKRAMDYLWVVNDKSIFQRLARRIYPNWLHTQSLSQFRFTVPVDREQLKSARLQVEQLLESFKQWKEAQYAENQIRQQLQQHYEHLASLESDYQDTQERLAQYPTVDFYDRFYQEHHDLQVQLFEASWEFLQQEALSRRSEIVSTLQTYESALIGDQEELLKIKLDYQNFFTRLSLVFPVLSSTLQSIANLIPVVEPDVINFLILDEAGATPIHQAIPALARTQQAAVIGDPKQIEPIINLCADTIQAYYDRCFRDRGLSFEDYQRYSPTAKETATAFHRAAGASSEDLGRAILLQNHYRSVPKIAAYFSSNYPGELNILSSDRPSALGQNLIAYHVEGVIQNRINQEEIQAIERIVHQLFAHNYSPNQIGVLSPFFHQSVALRTRLRERWRVFSWQNVGTIHDFQGGEKSVIILSPFQCNQTYLSFLNRRPNLLNTAVSRAQELFILVGNLAELKSSGETRRLVLHCEEFGEIRALPNQQE